MNLGDTQKMNETLPTVPLLPSPEPVPRSPTAEHMRRHRARRRRQVRCLQIEVNVAVIDGLIGKKYLEPEMRNDPDAIEIAIYDFFFEAL